MSHVPTCRFNGSSCSPGFEVVCAGWARWREGARVVTLAWIGWGGYDGWWLSPEPLPHSGCRGRELVQAAVGGWRVKTLMRRSRMTPAQFAWFAAGGRRVQSRGIDATVARASFPHGVGVTGITRVTEGTGGASTHGVKPAFVTVAAGGVTGQSVTAGVAGVLRLALRERDRQTERLSFNENFTTLKIK